jgi:uncharacterized Zn finger protein
MSWYYYDDDAQEAREAVRREIARRQKQGEGMKPLEAPGGSAKLVKQFWGKSWCLHLERYMDYASRLPRGRSYLRQGHVYDMEVQPGRIAAVVAGKSLYDVAITIAPLPTAEWERIKKRCAGQVGSLLDLLSGKLGDGVLQTICDGKEGLFPKAKEIRFNCSCPDYADLCKHAAAVLYGVGVKFDRDPALFFTLRKVDPAELIAQREDALATLPMADAALSGEDLSALFGIDLQAEAAPLPEPVRQVAKSSLVSKAAKQQSTRMAKGNNAHRKEVKKPKKEKPKPLPTQR